ncbi:hypothetical protein LNA02_09130 [Levilactobacillus namurensis]|nr:hypothetical protein LNA02_09130 [Levilactobacillus namurensis]
MVRRRSGFTVYEMVLVLIVVAGMLTLLARPARVTQAVYAERAFWPAFQRFWQSSRQTAMRKHRQVQIKVVSDQRQLQLWTYPPNERIIQRLPLPGSLRLEAGQGDSFLFYPSGYVRARTVIWRSRETQRWWHQAIQLGGRVFEVTETTTPWVRTLGER